MSSVFIFSAMLQSVNFALIIVHLPLILLTFDCCGKIFRGHV